MSEPSSLHRPVTLGELQLTVGNVCIALHMVSTALIAVYRGDHDQLLDRIEAVNKQSQTLFDMVKTFAEAADE